MNAKRSFVLLRGLGRESRHWGRFLPLLQKQEFCSKVILCDLPGAGIYHKEAGVDSVPKMLKDLMQKHREEFKAQEPLVVLGFSLGGMLAMEGLSEYPELFSEFVLINSSVGNLSPFYKRMLPSAIPKILKVAGAKDIATKEHLILSLISQAHKEDSELLKEYVHIAETAPMSLFTLIQQIIAGARYHGPSKAINKRGLVLYSKRDELVDFSCSIEIAKHLSAKSFAHEGAGHDLTLDDPEWVIARMKDFFGDS